MSDFGITETGFKRKRLDQILQEKIDEMKSVFGDNFNVSPESPDGQILGIISESDALLWELGEDAYNSYIPSKTSGVPLSDIVQLNGITRQVAAPTRAQVTLSGIPLTVVPAGSIVSTNDTNDQFTTEFDVTLDGIGSSFVEVVSVTTGAIQALAGTITVINTPITGWLTVTNPLDAIAGRDDETDPELRSRRVKSQGANAQAVLDGMFAAVSNVEGVTQATVLENDTNATDANGLPPKSFEVIAVGGLDQDIVDIIWIKKVVGILAFGNTTLPVVDSQGLPHQISFSRADVVEIFVEVDLTTFPDYPGDGDDLIKQAIVDYANGILVENEGFGLGQDVLYTRLFTPINSVQGHEVTGLRIGTAPSPTGEVNIPIGVTEISNFTIANIVVNS